MKAKERHEIKTDRFLEIAAVAQEFLLRHARLIAFVLGAILIVVIGWFGITWFIDFRENNASADLDAALEALNQAKYSTEAGSASLSDAEKMLQAVNQNHGGTTAAASARFRLAVLRFEEGKTDEAKADLKAIIDSRHPYYWELASMSLGEIFEGEKNYEEACKVYRQVADTGTTQMPLALFDWKAGNCLEELGKKDEALNYYNAAKKSETSDINSTLSTAIERKIKELSKITTAAAATETK
jgi:predicted negative regulator of RcsB-dependent stress response